MNYIALLLSFSLSALVTAVMIPRIILISFKKKLFDTVDERKVHTGVVPRLGGVAFAPALMVSYALVFGFSTLLGYSPQEGGATPLHLALGVCALLLIYFEGITDDLVGVGYKVKFLVQALCALLIVLSGVWLNDLYGLFGIHTLPWYVGKPLTVVLLVYVINAINLIDGIDGLASGLSMVALFFLGCLFASLGNWVSAGISLAMLGALMPFFRFNVFGKAERHNKIFMGDCGSQLVGLVLGMEAVWFCMYSEEAGIVTSMPNALVVAFSLLMIPCLDVIRVMLGRLRRGKNPFLPDKTHIHHKFLALGMSHRTAMLTILMIDFAFALLNLQLVSLLNINLLLLLDVALWCAMNLWVSQIIKKKQGAASETEGNSAP